MGRDDLADKYARVMYGPEADPRSYDKDGNYCGPVYGMAPLSGGSRGAKPIVTSPKGGMRSVREAPAAPGSSSTRRMAEREALETGAIRPTTPQRAGVTRLPEHHVFPQAHRRWFEDRGVKIDKYKVELDRSTHEALHYGGGPGKGGGWWNETIMKRLNEREASIGRKLTSAEIEQVGKEMMKEAKIDHVPFSPCKEPG